MRDGRISGGTWAISNDGQARKRSRAAHAFKGALWVDSVQKPGDEPGFCILRLGALFDSLAIARPFTQVGSLAISQSQPKIRRLSRVSATENEVGVEVLKILLVAANRILVVFDQRGFGVVAGMAISSRNDDINVVIILLVFVEGSRRLVDVDCTVVFFHLNIGKRRWHNFSFKK